MAVSVATDRASTPENSSRASPPMTACHHTQPVGQSESARRWWGLASAVFAWWREGGREGRTCAGVVEGGLEVEQQAAKEQRPALRHHHDNEQEKAPLSWKGSACWAEETRRAVVVLSCLYAVGASSVLEEGLFGLVPVMALQLLHSQHHTTSSHPPTSQPADQ